VLARLFIQGTNMNLFNHRTDEYHQTFRSLGINAILFVSLEDSAVIKQAASQHDIVIHMANSFHTPSAIAIIHGLAERAKRTAREVHLIHTSGTSNLSDQPITGNYLEPVPKEWSDKPDDVFAYENLREGLQVYAQRTTEIAVVEAGLEVCLVFE
jgi:hypothetical protein